ncbi:DUF4199 domain-containing protein [Zunongwangia atlantica]|uniref:DUF4199 domain-containing protein n=1 Tax=Zunongwangia atlantica 22II14-10F7 TaxID=1185767 RepID=A0A1Y1T4X0_9FLAO|nr:DUF4199 domain-containing protein [Zunongwangia atlantica]ORL45615.1 hypothetical protein IIF7_10398 [Zunongwangia atlantica 22II14-10F7]
MENSTSVKSVAAPFGIYIGIFLSLVTVLAYVFNLELFTKWWLGVLNFIIIIAFLVAAEIKTRKVIANPAFSFKDAFIAAFIPIAIGMLISTITTIIIFNFVDPEAAQVVMEYTAEMTRNMMSGFGVPEADINEAVQEVMSNNQFSLLNQLKSYIYQLAFWAVIGLILALIFRKKDPQAY